MPMPLDIITLGEALIDLPSTQSGVSLVDAPGFAKVPAGAPANVAVAAAKLGLQTAFLSKVGDDPFGESIIRTFAKHGVDTTRVLKDKAARTGLAFMSVQPDGGRDFLFYFDPARDLALRPDELDFDWLDTTRVLHYGSISLIAEPSRSATLTAAGHLIQKGRALCSYDPNLRPWLWPDAKTMRGGVMLGFTVADLVKISVEELLFLVPEAIDEAAAVQSLLHEFANLKLIAVTEGALGSRGYTRQGGFADAPGFHVHLVDATGAGDAYMAGLLTYLLEQGPEINDTLEQLGARLAEALRYANACGALATTYLGATPHGLTRESIQALMETQK
jgi:fructokinase